MSFDPLIKALEENPALAEELGNAKTPRERDAILEAHGIEKPNLDSQFPEAGGWWTSNQNLSPDELRMLAEGKLKFKLGHGWYVP